MAMRIGLISRACVTVAAVTMAMLMLGFSSMCRAQSFVDETVRIGIIVDDKPQEHYFLTTSKPHIIDSLTQFDIAGCTFYPRLFSGKPIILVRSGEGVINAATTTESLLTHFTGIRYLIHFGNVAASKSTLEIGDFVIRSKVAHAGYWYWQNLTSTTSKGVQKLKFADYTRYSSSDCIFEENDLHQIWYSPSQLITSEGKIKSAFWLSTSKNIRIPNVELNRCERLEKSRVCLEKQPRVVKNVSGCTADIFVANAAYTAFLGGSLHCDSIDMQAAAVAQVCYRRPGVELLSTGTVSNRGGLSGKENNVPYNIFTEISYRNAVRAIGAIIIALPRDSGTTQERAALS